MTGKSGEEIGFQYIGERYLHTSLSLFNIIIDSGNRNMLVGVSLSSEEEIDKSIQELEDAISKSDVTIMIPALFLFLHGIESTLKGLLMIKGVGNKDHKMDNLLLLLEEYYPSSIELIEVIKKYVVPSANMPPMISQFVTDNGIKSHQEFYQALRYVERRGYHKLHSYTSLIRNHDSGIEFAKGILGDIELILKGSVIIHRDIE